MGSPFNTESANASLGVAILTLRLEIKTGAPKGFSGLHARSPGMSVTSGFLLPDCPYGTRRGRPQKIPFLKLEMVWANAF